MQNKMRARRLLAGLCGFTAAGALFVALYRFTGFGIPCLFYNFTGFYCPGCGTMRAVVALSRLQFYQALRFNALFVLSLPFLVGFSLLQAIAYLRAKPIKTGWGTWVFVVLFCVASVLFAILRNVPQFAFLAPTVVG